MGLLNENIAQTISDFNDIKSKIIEKGVEVPDGTKTSEYANKISDVYDEGVEEGKASVIDETKVELITASGTGFLEVNDIADIKKELVIKTSPNATITAYYDNLFIGDFINGTFNPSDGSLSTPSTNRVRSMNYIELEPGEYTIQTPNTNHRFVVYLYDKNGNYLEAGSNKSWSPTNTLNFTITTACKILFAICVYNGATITPTDVAWVYLQKTDKAQPQTLTANTSGEINEVSNGVRRILLITGEYTDLSITYYKSIETGYNNKYSEGYDKGYNVGYSVGVVNDGEECSKFWDGYQSMGGRTDYRWSCINSNFIVDKDTTPRWNFTPKYDVKVNIGNAMFRCFNNNSSGGVNHEDIYIDLVEWFDNLGVKFNTDNLTDAGTMFYNAQGIKRIPVINLSKCTAANTTANFVGQMARTVTIDGIISSENTVWYSTTFTSNNPLKHCIFNGVIGKNFYISNATKLDKESLLSILDCLKDLTDTGTSLTCTLGTTNLAKLTDDEKAIATEKGWTLA